LASELKREKLISDPKKAILSISVPMIIAMTGKTLYNLVDAIWVSGLGADSLSAVGIFFPFYFLVLAISSSISVGGGVAFARKVGANDKLGAQKILQHSYFYVVVISLAYSIPLLVLSKEIFLYVGADKILSPTLEYARIMFFGTLIIFFSDLSNSILRNQGDAKRSMIAMLAGSAINIVLDPILIYTMDMGIAGAAWATLLSYLASSFLAAYWLFWKGDCYVRIRLFSKRISKAVTMDIFKVGVPASLQTVSFSLFMFLLNGIVLTIGSTEGVAVFTTGWRVMSMGTLPLIGISMGVSTITGATYGAKCIDKLRGSYYYALRIGMIFETCIAMAIFLLAPYIAMLFTQGEGGALIYGDLVKLLRIICIYLPIVSLSMFSSSLFNGIGKGLYALLITIMRTVVFTLPAAYFLGITLGYGLDGVWASIVLANFISGAASFAWARSSISKISTGV